MAHAAGANTGRMAGRVALITGASRGIGAAIARAYGAQGAQLVLVARQVAGLEQADDAQRRAGGAPAVLVPLDVADGAGIDRMAAALDERFGRLDVLVGNAALLGALTPTDHVDPALWQRVFDVNVTANWRLIRATWPLLRRSRAGRAIFVTSGAARATPPYWSPYAASKAALEALLRCWAGEIAKTAVKANLLDPGIVRTDMRQAAFPGEDPQRLPPPETVAEAFVQLALPSWQGHGERVAANRWRNHEPAPEA